MAPRIGKFEVNTSGITNILLVQRPKSVKLYQNDELITVVTTPIMKIVRVLRKRYADNILINVI